MTDIRSTQPHLYRTVPLERVNTGMGWLFALLRVLRLTGPARWLMRKPRHVGNYVDPQGNVIEPIHIQSNPIPMNKLATVRLKGPGLKLWQQVPDTNDVRVVEVEYGINGKKRAMLVPGMPVVAALNEKNARRKLHLTTKPQ